MNTIAIVTYVVGSVGFVLILLILPFAFCHCCIPFFPVCVSCGYWIIGSVFALLGIVVNLLSLVFSAACGEVELQYQREPGVFQWYVVPLCKSKFDFNALNGVVRDTEVKFARDACTKLLEACDNNPEPNLNPTSLSAVQKLAASFTAMTADASSLVNAATSGGVSLPSIPSTDSSTISAVAKKIPADVPENIPAKIPGDLGSVVSQLQPPSSSGSSGSQASAGAKATGNPKVNGGKKNPGTGNSNIDISKLDLNDLKKAADLVPKTSEKGPKGSSRDTSEADLIAQLGIKGLPPGIDLAKLRAGLPKDMDLKLPPDFNPNDFSGEVEKFVKESFKSQMQNFKPLRCGMDITSASQCTDFATMAHVFFTTTVKSITGVCPDKGKPCTMVECAYNCTNPTIAGIARQALEAALLARNASIAFSYARPLLEWNFVIDKLAESLETCNDFQIGTHVLGMGFLLGAVTFALGIYIMLRGSCIWGSTPKTSN